MFHQQGAPGFRGIFVSQLASAMLRQGGIHLEVEVVAQSRGQLDYFWSNSRVRERWNRDGYDIAHCHYGLTGLATLGLPNSAPLVATFYGSDINIGWQRRISQATLGRARRRIFVSRRLEAQWPSPRNIVLPNGIDFEICRPLDRGEACRALGLDPAKRWILFGGARDNPVKGYDLFRESMGFLQTTHPGVQELVLSEPGQPYERVVQKLSAASCLLFTSRRGSEGSPTVVKEALVVGLPVVSVDVGDAAEMMAGVVPGVVVPWPDHTGSGTGGLARSLANEVADVLHAGTRSNGRVARESLRQELIAGRLAAIYRDVLREAGRDLRYR